ncbi:MAG: hypothetical protein ACRDQZ_18180, partial [Mycobacteriales bacterium]
MRVARLLLRLLAVAATLAGSFAAAALLLNVDLSATPETTRTTAPVRVQSTSTRSGKSRHAASRYPTTALGERSSALSAMPFRAGVAASWETLAGSIPARVGLAISALGSDRIRAFGSLQSGHAWSSIKVPILTTLLHERGGRNLTAAESSLARAALTSSDNAAAAALFRRIEKTRGGLSGASLAVQETLRASGDDSTTVATDPPPPGAVSTYGQT